MTEELNMTIHSSTSMFNHYISKKFKSCGELLKKKSKCRLRKNQNISKVKKLNMEVSFKKFGLMIIPLLKYKNRKLMNLKSMFQRLLMPRTRKEKTNSHSINLTKTTKLQNCATMLFSKSKKTRMEQQKLETS